MLGAWGEAVWVTEESWAVPSPEQMTRMSSWFFIDWYIPPVKRVEQKP